MLILLQIRLREGTLVYEMIGWGVFEIIFTCFFLSELLDDAYSVKLGNSKDW